MNEIGEIKDFHALFKVILTGNKDESRLAARATKKLLYSSRGNSKEIRKIIDSAALVYKDITEEFRQENFVMAISVMYFMHDREAEPDFLFPWFFQLLQHKK